MSNNVDEGKRDFLGMMFGTVAAVGGVASLGAMKASWDPLPSVKAAGFTTVDLSGAEENVLNVEKWRGKPIFVLKKSADMKSDERDILVDGSRFFIAVGLCTHLGCIPAYVADETLFRCACHGGEFDTAGRNTFGPPPSPLVIPPFNVKGTTIVLGEEGEDFKKMKANGLIA